MWLSKQMINASGQNEALISTGIVTISGEKPSVMLGGERRELRIAAPTGLKWMPDVGEEVLVLRSDDGEQIIIGSASEKHISGELIVKGGLSIDGDLYVSGRMFVNGIELGEVLAAMQKGE